MSDHIKKSDRSLLCPVRHPGSDSFVCGIFDAAPTSDLASMENPFFILSTRPDMTARGFRRGENWLELQPSPLGLETVHDRDMSIYCGSQSMAALNEGRQMRFIAHDLLKMTNKATHKKGYEPFRNALELLQGTQVETNITTCGQE